jgi:SAM-dependent methyltransferase
MSSKPANTPGEFWGQHYADENYVFGQELNQWMAANAALIQPDMKALVPGDGEGRNGVWLAQQGLQVTTLDASAVGVPKARKLAAAQSISLDARIVDLQDWDLGPDGYGLLVSAFLHVNVDDRSDIHRKFAQSLKSGGLLLLEGFAPDHLGYGRGGPSVKEMTFTTDCLREDFGSMMDIEHLEEARIGLHASERHGGPAVVIRLRARRKLP